MKKTFFFFRKRWLRKETTKKLIKIFNFDEVHEFTEKHKWVCRDKHERFQKGMNKLRKSFLTWNNKDLGGENGNITKLY